MEKDTKELTGKNDKPENTQALALRQLSITEIEKLATAFAKSHYFDDAKEVSQAIVKIQAGLELGFGPVYSMTKVYIYKGKVTIMAEAMGAKVKNSGRYDYHVVKLDNNECILSFTDNGKEVYTSKFTIADAKLAGLVKPDGGWSKFPRAMLVSKALSQGARIVCPHVISGVYTPEDFGLMVDEDGVIEGEATEVTDEPEPESERQESESTEQVSEPEKAASGTGDYSWLLEKCPEHEDTWRKNKFNKRFHPMPSGFCNLSEQIKPYIEKASSKSGLANSAELNQWLKDNYAGRTWSKLTEEEQVEVINRLNSQAVEHQESMEVEPEDLPY